MIKIIIKSKAPLLRIIKEEIKIHGVNCDLNHLDVSKIINMTSVFYKSQFNRDLTNWKPYKLHNKHDMFKNCPSLQTY